MTLEYLELMEDVKSEKPTRRKLQKSFKSNTRIYDDGSIEVDPQAQGEPSQRQVKKVGKSKRYITSGKNPLTCVELKCPEDVPDKAAYFHKELAKLTKDIQIQEPEMPKEEFLIDKPNLKVEIVRTQGTVPLCSAGCAQQGQSPCANQQGQSPCAKVMAWLTFETKGLLEIRRELYSLTSEIDKCFVINETLVAPQR